MALTALEAVWGGSRSAGNARLVLLVLAWHVNEERLTRGYPAEAWPSQTTIAGMCGCSRSTVERGLHQLVELGELVDSGSRRTRGTVVWEIAIDVLTQNESDHADLTQNGSPEEESQRAEPHLTHPGDDLTHPGDDLTHPESRPASPVTNKPVEPEVEPENERGSAASPTDVVVDGLCPPWGWPENLIERLHDEHCALTEGVAESSDPGRRATLVHQLAVFEGDEIVMDMWARRLPHLLRSEDREPADLPEVTPA
jgi:Helix-turn-helix domain